MVLVIDKLPSAVNLLLQNIDQDLEDVSKKVATITLWLRQCYKVDKDFLAPIFAIRIRLASVKVDDLNEYKRVLVFYLQYQKNLEYENTIIQYLYIYSFIKIK